MCPHSHEQSFYTIDFVSSEVVAILAQNLICVGLLPTHSSLQPTRVGYGE